MKTAKSVMNVEKNSTHFVAGIIVVFVGRYFATDVATWKFLDWSWDTQVSNCQLNLTCKHAKFSVTVKNDVKARFLSSCYPGILFIVMGDKLAKL